MTLAQIKQAVDALTPAEMAELSAFVKERIAAAWDAEIERDAAAGRLDFLFDEAANERRNDPLRDRPAMF